MMAIAHLAEVTIRVPDSLRDSIRARLGCLITFLRLQMRPLLPRLFSFFLSYLISLFLRNKISRREEYRSNPSLLPLNLELDFKS